MLTVAEQSLERPDVSTKAELTLADVYTESDKIVAESESTRDFVAQERRLYHDYYDEVREALKWADPHARETAARIFAAIMEPDVRETCREWVGKDGRVRLDGRLYTVENTDSTQ